MVGADLPPAIANRKLTAIATLVRATESEVSFVQRERYRQDAEKSKAGLILVPHSIDFDGPNVAKIDDVMTGVLKVIAFFHPAPPIESFIHPTAIVPESCKIADGVYIGAYSVLGENVQVGAGTHIDTHCIIGDATVLGENCRCYPRVTILERCLIGARVILHPGCVIGGDGFRYEVLGGRLTKIPQVGRVVLEDDVEIGANTTIDRAFLADTLIGARSKIDNMAHIGHNVTMGTDCIIVAQVGIAGSARIGRGVMIGGQAAVKDHISIGDGVRIGGRSAVTTSLPAGAEVMGSPPVPLKDYGRYTSFLRNFSTTCKYLRPIIEERKKMDSRQSENDEATK